MIPEIGQIALILALMLAITQATLPLIGAARGIPQLIALARPTAQAQFIFVAVAFCCLAYSFISNDFSVLNVATNSNSQRLCHGHDLPEPTNGTIECTASRAATTPARARARRS